jgi:hypothetical protein
MPKLTKYKLVKPFNNIFWKGRDWSPETITDDIAEALSKRNAFADYFAPVGKSKEPVKPVDPSVEEQA